MIENLRGTGSLRRNRWITELGRQRSNAVCQDHAQTKKEIGNWKETSQLSTHEEVAERDLERQNKATATTPPLPTTNQRLATHQGKVGGGGLPPG